MCGDAEAREFPTIGWGKEPNRALHRAPRAPDTVSVCPLLLRAADESISDIIVLMSRSLAIASKRIMRIGAHRIQLIVS